jgi:hypothetical protein
MSNNQSSILWWSYDSENRSFGSLPAGPMLLPAIGILAFVALIQSIKERDNSPESILGKERINSKLYKDAKKRQNELIEKRANAGLGLCNDLTVQEAEELRRLQRPQWANGGEWSY